MRTHKFEQAESVLREGLGLHPDHPEIGWIFGNLLIRSREYEEAEAFLAQLAEANPSSRLPYLGLVRSAEAQGDLDRAMAFADEAERRTSATDFRAKYELALELSRLPGSRNRALEVAREAANGMPDHSLSSALVGTLLELEDDPAALDYIERARRTWRSPNDFDESLKKARARLSEDRPSRPG